jgi:hypothetical protein
VIASSRYPINIAAAIPKGYLREKQELWLINKRYRLYMITKGMHDAPSY